MNSSLIIDESFYRSPNKTFKICRIAFDAAMNPGGVKSSGQRGKVAHKRFPEIFTRSRIHHAKHDVAESGTADTIVASEVERPGVYQNTPDVLMVRERRYFPCLETTGRATLRSAALSRF